MIIRQATEKDIWKVKRIIDSLQVSRKQENWREAKTGFFEYSKTRQELIGSLNPYFIVAETKQGINGFSLGYDFSLFQQKFGNSEVPSFRYILENIQGKYFYWDMIGTLGPKVANGLTNFTFNLARSRGLEMVVGFICEEPWKNQRSINYSRKKGFKRTTCFESKNEIVLGVYKLNL